MTLSFISREKNESQEILISKTHTLECHDCDLSNRTEDLGYMRLPNSLLLSLSSIIDLGIFKSNVKFFNDFPFDPRMLKF